jgi:hypothetical protein
MEQIFVRRRLLHAVITLALAYSTKQNEDSLFEAISSVIDSQVTIFCKIKMVT